LIMADTAYLRAVIGLIIVVGVILACAWMARRTGLLAKPRGNSLRQVSGLSLGPRQRISVVEIESTWLVLGISAGQINLLHTLPAPIAHEATRDKDAEDPSVRSEPGTALPQNSGSLAATFAGKLAGALKRR
jgi:flagellar protein FliO/FliZ